MASLAKVILVGNLGRDPETRYTPNGAMNVNFSMAVNRRWRDSSGKDQENTTWFRVTAWGKLAETLDGLTQRGWVTKGRQVYVEGRIEAREWTDQGGQNRTSLEVSATEFQLLGSGGDGDAGSPRSRGGESEGDSRVEEQKDSADWNDVPF